VAQREGYVELELVRMLLSERRGRDALVEVAMRQKSTWHGALRGRSTHVRGQLGGGLDDACTTGASMGQRRALRAACLLVLGPGHCGPRKHAREQALQP
jgi:hypothetical protein